MGGDIITDMSSCRNAARNLLNLEAIQIRPANVVFGRRSLGQAPGFVKRAPTLPATDFGSNSRSVQGVTLSPSTLILLFLPPDSLHYYVLNWGFLALG